MDLIDQAVPAQKGLALIAHDNRKPALINWCQAHRAALSAHRLYATGTTGQRISAATGLDIKCLLSGPLGGDQQVGALIAEGQIDLLIFFWDPFSPLPHDPDVKALLRIAAVWDTAVACTEQTANYLISSPWLTQPGLRRVPNLASYQAERHQDQA